EKKLNGKIVFDLYQNFGFPFELTQEIAREKGIFVSKEEFDKFFKEHQAVSRKSAIKKFGGHGLIKEEGSESEEKIKKFHTATHLLHAALRKILGQNVSQQGSDINPERLRFDFSFPRKLSKEELKMIEDLVNQKIKENLEVKKEKKKLTEAIKEGALAFFKEKYSPEVFVYSIGDFSREVCAGPHVKRTLELGHFKIIKEKGLGTNLRRVYAILE
ncbi:MAG: alanine--tRNA ligase-related protein, partial [Minisyncoccales bacterium]